MNAPRKKPARPHNGAKKSAKKKNSSTQGTRHGNASKRGGPASTSRSGKPFNAGKKNQRQGDAPPAQPKRGRRMPRLQGPVADPGAHVMTVGPETGTDLAHFLAMSVPGKLSIRAIRRLLEQGRCRINGRVETYGSRKVVRGDMVSFVAPDKQERRQRFAFDPDRVCYAAHDLVVYDKPPGLPVTPTDAGSGPSLVGVLRRDLGDLLACHRIDADTSGVVLLARTEELRALYETAFRDHTVRKRYLALVRGHPSPRGSRRSGLLLQDVGQGFERWGSGRGEGALLAITTWRLVERIGREASLLRIEPKTGRTHQIRVHMSELEHPLLGDRVYGDRRDPIHVPRHLLHAESIEVPHPSGTGRLTVDAPMPPDFDTAISKLRT